MSLPRPQLSDAAIDYLYDLALDTFADDGEGMSDVARQIAEQEETDSEAAPWYKIAQDLEAWEDYRMKVFK